MERKKDSDNKFLSKSINLLLKEKKSEHWQKVKNLLKATALFLFVGFLVVVLGVGFYSWRLSSYDIALEMRVEQAKAKIVSLKKEEETYLALTRKIKNAEEILTSQGIIIRFLKEIELLIPPEISPPSLDVDRMGNVNIAIPPLSLSDVENLNQNLKKAVNEGKISDAKIGGISRIKEDQYSIGVTFKLEK